MQPCAQKRSWFQIQGVLSSLEQLSLIRIECYRVAATVRWPLVGFSRQETSRGGWPSSASAQRPPSFLVPPPIQVPTWHQASQAIGLSLAAGFPQAISQQDLPNAAFSYRQKIVFYRDAPCLGYPLPGIYFMCPTLIFVRAGFCWVLKCWKSWKKALFVSLVLTFQFSLIPESEDWGSFLSLDPYKRSRLSSDMFKKTKHLNQYLGVCDPPPQSVLGFDMAEMNLHTISDHMVGTWQWF